MVPSNNKEDDEEILVFKKALLWHLVVLISCGFPTWIYTFFKSLKFLRKSGWRSSKKIRRKDVAAAYSLLFLSCFAAAWFLLLLSTPSSDEMAQASETENEKVYEVLRTLHGAVMTADENDGSLPNSITKVAELCSSTHVLQLPDGGLEKYEIQNGVSDWMEPGTILFFEKPEAHDEKVRAITLGGQCVSLSLRDVEVQRLIRTSRNR